MEYKQYIMELLEKINDEILLKKIYEKINRIFSRDA